MPKKRAQGTFTVIVAAVIGLIIIVVVVMMLTGKLGAFGAGVEAAVSCENACKATGHDLSGVGTGVLTESGCNLLQKSTILPGKFGDIPEGNVCCCYSRVS